MKRNRALTLLECVFAILIMAVTISGTLFAFVAGRMHAAVARHHYQAVSAAREKMEDIIQAGIPQGAGPPQDEAVTIDPGLSEVGDELTGTMNVTFDPDPANGLTAVTVKVSWKEALGANRDETFVILINAREG